MQPYPEMPVSRASLAIHEGAHLIVADVLGIRHDGVELLPEGESIDVDGWPTGGRMLRPPTPPDLNVELDPQGSLERLAAMMWAALCFAGKQGEMLFHDLPEPGAYCWTYDSDHSTAEKILMSIFGEVDYTLAHECQQWARGILMDRWPSVLAVAQKLETDGQIAANEVAAMHDTQIQ